MTIGGGTKAIRSVLRYARKIGPFKLYEAVTSKNACKACAFGTGGQHGGLHNESRRGIEICNKNIQAHLSDIRAAIPGQLFFEKSIDELASLSGKQLEDLGRIGAPLYKKAGDRHYTTIDYDRALALVAERLIATDPARTFFYASGRSSNEAAFSLQLLARLYGTNNINNCSYYCHQASGVGLTSTIGSGTATVRYDDLNSADTIFVFGANPASNHPRYVKTLLKCRRRGGSVIVVNPAKEPGMVRFASPSDWRSMLKGGEAVASHYVQPHLGGDIAFMHGIAKWLLESNRHDAEFIDRYTEGFAAFQEKVNAISWQDIVSHSGVTRETIEIIAGIYADSGKTIFSWSMGMTHHLHGVQNIETLVALALLRGMVGKPGAGLLPLRGHSNIQGTGSMGFTPELKASIESKLIKKLGATLPNKKGLDTMACMEAANQGAMDVSIQLGGNLLASNPDTNFAKEALNKTPFKCFINSTLNMSHVNGVDGESVILPIKVRDEELQPTTQESMFNFVRLSDGGINRFDQLKSEMDIICSLGEQLIDKARFDFSIFRDHKKVREFVGEVIPGFNQMKYIDESKTEFHIDGRTFYQPVFPTPTGKALFSYHSAPKKIPASYILTSVRSEGQFNSIIYDERDTYRDQPERWVVMMHPDDIAEEGLVENQLVTLRTATGQMEKVKVRSFNIRRGNLMTYYPEANVLISSTIDTRSKTPAFKSIPVDIIVK